MYRHIKHNNGNISIQTLSVKPDRLVLYNQYQGENFKIQLKDVTKLDNKTNGLLSYKAKKRLETSLDWLYFLSRKVQTSNGLFYRLSDITLTIPNQKVSDKDLVKLGLNHFLTICRKRYNMEHYIWKAETQSNGNLHFHIITNSFIPKNDLTKLWNNILKKKSLQIIPNESNPPSTNVRGLKIRDNSSSDYTYLRKKYASKQNNSITPKERKEWKKLFNQSKPKEYQYLRKKYASKNNDNRRAVDCKIWFVSQKLSRVKKFSLYVTDKLINDLKDVVFDIVLDNAGNEIKGVKVSKLSIHQWFNNLKILTNYLNLFLSHIKRGFHPDSFNKDDLYLYQFD